MKIGTSKDCIEFEPEDSYDYFLLGRISQILKQYNYDFNRVGEGRTIKIFRIRKDELLSLITEIGK